MEHSLLAEEGENAMNSEVIRKHMNTGDELYSKIQLIVKRLLLGYIEYYPNNLEKSDYHSNFNKSFLWACFESIILIFQILTLGQPYRLYQDSANFEWFYTIISPSRPDLVLASLAFYTFAFIIHSCIVFILSIVFLFNLYKAVKPSATKRWIILSTLIIDRIFRRYIYIPALVGFLTSIKFNMLPESKAEYFYSNDVSILQHYAISTLSGPLLALSLLHVSLFSLIDNQEKGCYNRSHSRIMLLETLSIFVCVVCQVFLNENHTIIQVTVQGLIGVYLAICYVKYLPYTYIYMNILKLFTYMSLAITSFVNLVNSINGSAGTVVLVTIVNLPLLYVFSYTIVKWRYRYINQIPFTKLNCPYLSEIQIREKTNELLKLIEEDNEEEAENYKLKIRSMFNYMENTYRNDSLAVCWYSRYLFEIEKDEELAKIKLSTVRHLPFSVDSNYLAMRYEYTFKELSKVYSEQLDYLKFREIYEAVKNQDIAISKLQLIFWNELDKPTPNIKKLKNTAMNIKQAIDFILKLGDRLISEYPQNTQGLYLYSTFLSDVYNDQERGQEMLQKYQFIKASSLDSFSLFNPRVGIMIISGDGNNTGKIEYLNQEASNILDIPAETAVSLNVAQFLPYPINDYKHHNKCMMNFIQNTPKTRVPLPDNSFIVNQKGFLINIIFEGKCVAYNSVVFFLAALKRNEDLGESALIGPDGVIQHHTENFPKLLDMRETTLVGYNLLAILPEVQQILQTNKNVMKISLLLRKLRVKFEEIQVKAVTFRLVTLSIEHIDMRDTDSDLSLTYVREYAKEDLHIGNIKSHHEHKVKFVQTTLNKTLRLDSMIDYKVNTNLKSEAINSSTGGTSSYSIANSPLDVKMRKTVTKSVKLLKISILVSKLAVCVCLIAIIIFLSIYQQKGEIEKYFSINKTMVYFNKFALHSKLMTFNQGFDDISDNILTFKGLLEEFNENIQFLKDDYSKSNIIYWEMRSQNYFKSHDYLLQLLLKIYDAIVSIENSNDLNLQAEGFFLRRNGEGEAMLRFNETLYEIEREVIENSKQVILDVNLMSIICVLMNFIFILLFIVPSIINIEKAQQRVWDFYFNINSVLICEIKQKIESRLDSMHNIKSKELNTRDVTETSDKKAKVLNRIWYKPILHLSFYYILLGALALYYQFDFMSSISSNLFNSPEIIHLDSQRLLSLQSHMYWRLENIQPSDILLWNYEERLKSTNYMLRYAEKKIHELKYNRGSKEHELAYSNAGTGVLNFGIHSAINYFLQLNIAETDLNSDIEIMKQILSTCEEIREIHLDSFQRNMKDTIDRDTAISVVFCILTILLYIIYYLPICSKLENEIIDCWKLTKLIPNDLPLSFRRKMKRDLSKASL